MNQPSDWKELKHVCERDRVSYGKRKLDQMFTAVKETFSSVLNIEDDSQKENVARKLTNWIE